MIDQAGSGAIAKVNGRRPDQDAPCGCPGCGNYDYEITQKGAERKAWRTYEEVAAHLLNRLAKEFGLKFVEGKQKIQGQLTTWEIDAKGIVDDENLLIVECRRHTTSKQSQKDLGALAFSIIDTGAAGGIIVSNLGLQEGAAKIAAGKNIVEVKLTANSTPAEFVIQFFDKLCLGIRGKSTSSARIHPRLLRKCAQCGKDFEISGKELLCNDCLKAEIFALRVSHFDLYFDLFTSFWDPSAVDFKTTW